MLDVNGKETSGRLFLSIKLLPDPPSLRATIRSVDQHMDPTKVRQACIPSHCIVRLALWGMLCRRAMAYGSRLEAGKMAKTVSEHTDE